MTTATTIRRFSRDEYHEMARTGILRPEERVELIHGEILAMTPQGTPHAAFIDFLDAQLQRAFGEQVAVRTQLPLALGETSEPEPDLAVVPGLGHLHDEKRGGGMGLHIIQRLTRDDGQIRLGFGCFTKG